MLLLVLGSGLPPLSPSWRGIGAMVASVLLIAGLSLRDDGVLARGLARPVPVFLGRISYGTYLWHWPVILVLEEVLVVSPKIVAVLAVGVATGLAAASYEVLEMPIRKNGFLDRFQWNTAVTGVAVSALVAVTLVPWALQLDRKPALAALDSASGVAGVATGKPARLPADVDWAKVEDDIGDEAPAPPRTSPGARSWTGRARTCCSSGTARPRCWCRCSSRSPRSTTCGCR